MSYFGALVVTLYCLAFTVTSICPLSIITVFTFVTPVVDSAASESAASVCRITILGDLVRMVSTNRAAYVYHGRSFDGSLAATWGSAVNGLYSSLG